MQTKQEKQAQAKIQLDNRSVLSDQDQLDRLDRRLGPNQGAKKERARLSAKIAAQVAVQAAKTNQPKKAPKAPK